MPITAHTAFEKAADYLGIKLIKIPWGKDFKVDLGKMRKAITKNTVLLVGSAPNYPHGIIDNIEEIAKIANWETKDGAPKTPNQKTHPPIIKNSPTL